MKMIYSLSVLFLLFFLSFTFCKEKESAHQFWVNKNIDWKYFKTGDPAAATVNVVIFHENGQFRLLSGNGGLGNDSIYLYVEISKIFSGTWEINNGEIELTYKLSCASFKQSGQNTSNQEFKTLIIDLNKKNST